MAKAKSTIQSEYRTRKAESGLRQVVLYLPEEMAEGFKAEAKQQVRELHEVVSPRG